MQASSTQLIMKGHLDIWTVTVEIGDDKQIIQTRDFDVALTEIGRAVITGGKRVTLQDDAKTVLDVELEVKDVEN